MVSGNQVSEIAARFNINSSSSIRCTRDLALSSMKDGGVLLTLLSMLDVSFLQKVRKLFGLLQRGFIFLWTSLVVMWTRIAFDFVVQALDEGQLS